MTKLLFLDFDGVLNSDRNYRRLQMAAEPTRDEYGTLFDAKCVKRLREIIEATGAEIVVSSSWRYVHDIDNIRIMWAKRGLPGIIKSYTPTDLLIDPMDNFVRGQEVEEWLKHSGLDDRNCRYAIIDDERQFLSHQLSHFVWTNPEIGLSRDNVLEAIQILLKGS